MSVNAVVDERALREIYLAGFEGAVRKGKPWTVMCAYNRLNGKYCSENPYLLTDILKKEWSFEGIVVSDWGAVNDRVAALSAGLELEMPGSKGIRDRKIVDAVHDGSLDAKVLDTAVEKLLEIIFRACGNRKDNAAYDKAAHHRLAGKAARESIVLLKNEDGILPLRKDSKVAVIGSPAKQLRYQGGGSSHITPTQLSCAINSMADYLGGDDMFAYAEGFAPDTDQTDPALLREAVETARQAEITVIFAGLPDSYESEGYDRKHIGIPRNQSGLIEAIAAVQENVVVVLSNGSPVEMPWLPCAKGVVECYLAGQAAGEAVVDVLYGETNPCGKLAETFPADVRQNPSWLNFPGEGDRVEYREGIFVGYRYYDAKSIQPLFAFGHGLSYTEFEYCDIRSSRNEIQLGDSVSIHVRIRNKGAREGKEIVQLYVRDIDSSVSRPEKELKGFEKVSLQPGEKMTDQATRNTLYQTILKSIIWRRCGDDIKVSINFR